MPGQDLTLDFLCEAIRFYLTEMAGPNPSPAVRKAEKLTLHGVPADDVMRAVLEQRNGKLVIEVHALPEQAKELAFANLADQTGPMNPLRDLWEPETVRTPEEQNILDVIELVCSPEMREERIRQSYLPDLSGMEGD